MRIVDLDSKNAATYNNLAVVQKNLKKHESATANWQQAIKLNPEFADAFYNLGLLEVQLSRFQEAENYLKKADQLKPK